MAEVVGATGVVDCTREVVCDGEVGRSEEVVKRPVDVDSLDEVDGSDVRGVVDDTNRVGVGGIVGVVGAEGTVGIVTETVGVDVDEPCATVVGMTTSLQ